MIGHLLPAAVFGALAEVLPEQVQATPGSPVNSVQLASLRGERRYVMNTFLGAGQGATHDRDGEPAISFPSNLSNTNIEVLETLVPVEVHQRSIRRGSGGAGAQRGGDGITFEFSLRGSAPAAAVTCLSSRRLRASTSSSKNWRPRAANRSTSILITTAPSRGASRSNSR